MWKNIGYDHCLSFINCQLNPRETPGPYECPVRPSVTISRMTGSGGYSIASKLADYLQARAPADCPWTVFDRNLMEKVLDDHHLSKRTAEFVPENHKSMLCDTVEEFLGLHPSTWTLVQQISETILHLAEMGNVILVGRGANVVTGKLSNVLRVRLAGSLEKRTERVQRVYSLDQRQALELIRKQDEGRRRYLKDHFGKEINDPLLYDLIINTDRLGYDEAARLIGDEVIHRFHLDRRAEAVAS
jgi:cytidylate kinase